MGMTNTGRVDFHHHLFPTRGRAGDLMRELIVRSGWPADRPLPMAGWKPETSLECMDELGIATAILSLPNDVEHDLPAVDRRGFAREVNTLAAQIAEEHPGRFGFFAHLPTPTTVDDALEELAYAFDELGADGVTLANVYGQGADACSLGNSRLEPLWAELDRRAALVFVHGEQTPGRNAAPNRFMPVPVSEVPNETYKAAADLVTSGCKRQFPRARIILSHSGGSTPLLAARVAALAPLLGCELTPEEIVDDFRTFYYETALSGFRTNLIALESLVPVDQILFGTDFPAVPTHVARWYARNVDDYYADRPAIHDQVMSGNAMKLVPRLATAAGN
ncbi:amidohydrolase family protein [Streptomyces sp. NPDC004629]|uniref:amidohydrolase family protein n=1 Tax=Streptomyces sp. NPDC004629 TaxID=3364705 RepID=UPI00369277D2